MSIINKIIAKLAGFDPQETEQVVEATLARTQSGHEAMPGSVADRYAEEAKHNSALAEERARIQQENARQRMMQQEAQQHGGIQPEGLPEVIVEDEEEKAA